MGMRAASSALYAVLALSALGGPIAPAFAQPAPRLDGSKPWYEETKGIGGYWDIQDYKMSNYFTPRQRAARTTTGEAPPLLPGPAAILEKRLVDAEHDKPYANSAARCLPQGMPYMLFAAVGGPLEILETPGEVTLISDAYNEFLQIYLNVPHAPKEDLEPTYHGESVGHWEGDTLVVDTIGLNDKTTLDQVGTPHSSALHVITRIRRLDPEMLEFRVTIDDPKTFSKPWERRVVYKKSAKDARVEEVVCENQRNGPGEDGFQTFRGEK